MAGMLMKIACMVVVCMVVLEPQAEAITCGQVTNNLLPCLSYLRQGGRVPTNCCDGVKRVKRAARTREDRKTACNCIKGASKVYTGIIEDYAAILPSKCGVRIPYRIRYSTDCARVL